jgi:hypothetical protein
MADIR